jgi:hypothetical protein
MLENGVCYIVSSKMKADTALKTILASACYFLSVISVK